MGITFYFIDSFKFNNANIILHNKDFEENGEFKTHYSRSR